MLGGAPGGAAIIMGAPGGIPGGRIPGGGIPIPGGIPIGCRGGIPIIPGGGACIIGGPPMFIGGGMATPPGPGAPGASLPALNAAVVASIKFCAWSSIHF